MLKITTHVSSDATRITLEGRLAGPWIKELERCWREAEQSAAGRQLVVDLAIRRGAAMTVDLNSGWDYWPVMGEQVEELRRRYNILPLEVFLPVERQMAGAEA